MKTEGLEKDIPCYQCICLPVCRNKDTDEIFKCNLARGYLNGPPNNEKANVGIRYNLLMKYLKFEFI